MQKSIAFKQILNSQGSVVYESQLGQVKYFTSGNLSVLLSFDGLLMLKINEFQYGVNPRDSIKYEDSDPQYQRVFYLKKYPSGLWILKINENADSVESFLREKCHLQNKNNNRTMSMSSQEQPKQQKKPTNTFLTRKKKMDAQIRQQQPEAQIQNQKTDKQSKGFSFSKMFISGAKLIGSGLTVGGNYVAKGIENAGGYISKKVQPTEKVEISESTKQNMKLASKTTNTILQFTGTQVGNLFNFGKKLATDIGERADETDTVKELKKSEYFEPIKDVGKTAIVAFSNLYQGAWNAVYSVGTGIAKGTTKIVEKRYGQEAGDVANEAFESTGNVVKLTRVAKDQAAKAFKSTEE